MGSKKLPRSSKNQNINIHFQRRMRDRHGLDITSNIRKEMVKFIQTGQAKKLEKQSNARGLYEIPVLPCIKERNSDFKGDTIIVIYDKRRKRLVTTLLPESEYSSGVAK